MTLLFFCSFFSFSWQTVHNIIILVVQILFFWYKLSKFLHGLEVDKIICVYFLSLSHFTAARCTSKIFSALVSIKKIPPSGQSFNSFSNFLSIDDSFFAMLPRDHLVDI